MKIENACAGAEKWKSMSAEHRRGELTEGKIFKSFLLHPSLLCQYQNLGWSDKWKKKKKKPPTKFIAYNWETSLPQEKEVISSSSTSKISKLYILGFRNDLDIEHCLDFWNTIGRVTFWLGLSNKKQCLR